MKQARAAARAIGVCVPARVPHNVDWRLGALAPRCVQAHGALREAQRICHSLHLR